MGLLLKAADLPIILIQRLRSLGGLALRGKILSLILPTLPLVRRRASMLVIRGLSCASHLSFLCSISSSDTDDPQLPGSGRCKDSCGGRATAGYMGLPEKSLSLNPGLCPDMDEESGAVHCLWRHRPNSQCSSVQAGLLWMVLSCHCVRIGHHLVDLVLLRLCLQV